MSKKVRYNGGTESYYGCSDPRILVVGKEYEVVSANDRCWQTDYTLKGVKGEFNSVWFDDVYPYHIAIACETPVIGENYHCTKIEFINGQPKTINLNTSPVKQINYLGNNVYEITTCSSVYIVKLNESSM